MGASMGPRMSAGGGAAMGMWPMGTAGMTNSCGGTSGAAGDAFGAAPGPGGLSKEQLQQLLQDEGKLRQFLADNPHLSREVMRMM